MPERVAGDALRHTTRPGSVEAGDHAAIEALLAEDVRFTSPVALSEAMGAQFEQIVREASEA